MTLVLKCLICHEEIEYSQHNPIELIKHMKTAHPRTSSKQNRSEKTVDKFDKAVEVSLGENAKVLYKLVTKSIQTDIAMNDLENISTPKCDEKLTNSKTSGEDDNVKELFVNKREDPPSTHRKVKINPKAPAKNNESNKNPERQKLLAEKKHMKFYRTSIEHWRPVGEAKIHCPRCQSHKRPIIRMQRQHVTNSSVVSSFLMACWPLCSSPCLLPEPKFENLHCPICNFHLGVFDHQKKSVMSNPRLRE